MAADNVKRSSEIRLKIGMNEENIPVDMKWMASDSDHAELKDCKSLYLSIWDPIEKTTLGIDLWTEDMSVDEMHAHYFQTLMTVTNSYNKATGNPVVLKDMKDFVESVAKRTREWEESK